MQAKFINLKLWFELESPVQPFCGELVRTAYVKTKFKLSQKCISSNTQKNKKIVVL